MIHQPIISNIILNWTEVCAVNDGDALSNTAYKYLMDKIMNSELLPGELINRRGIAKELGISVAPVLEAIVLMENEGLMESLPRKGTRVSIVSVSDITGCLFLRDALESTAARYFCGKVIQNAMSYLLPMAKLLDQAPSHSNEYFRLDREFHKALVALCRCDTYSVEHDRVTKLNLFHNISQLLATSDPLERKRHVELLELLCSATPDEASGIMHEHIITGKGWLVYKGVSEQDTDVKAATAQDRN